MRSEQRLLQGRSREGHAIALQGLALVGSNRDLWKLVSESYVAKGDYDAAIRARWASFGVSDQDSEDWRRMSELMELAGRSQKPRPPLSGLMFSRARRTWPLGAWHLLPAANDEDLGFSPSIGPLCRIPCGCGGGFSVGEHRAQRLRLRRPPDHHREHADSRISAPCRRLWFLLTGPTRMAAIWVCGGRCRRHSMASSGRSGARIRRCSM